MKSNVSADFIHSNNKEVVITTNKAVATSNLNIVEKYLKELNNVDFNDIISPWLPQLTLYLESWEFPISGKCKSIYYIWYDRNIN